MKLFLGRTSKGAPGSRGDPWPCQECTGCEKGSSSSAKKSKKKKNAPKPIGVSKQKQKKGETKPRNKK